MTTDNLDQTLSSAFDKALLTLERVDLTEQVLKSVRRRQRLRLLVMSMLIFVAGAACVINGLPLIGMLTAWFDQTPLATEISRQIPAILGVIAAISIASLLHVLVDDTL